MNVNLYDVVALLLVFQTKHYVADYLLQTEYMLGKFEKTYWLMPLLLHASVHAVFTYNICVSFGVPVIFALLLAFGDLIIHSIIDRIKASPKMFGCFVPSDKEFWWVFGLDQKLHHLTHYVIIYISLMLTT
jgi:hypothetical protein